MGNSQRAQSIPPVCMVDISSWRPVRHLPRYTIVTNGKLLAELYPNIVISRQLKVELEAYELRRNQDINVVRVLWVGKSSGSTISSQYNMPSFMCRPQSTILSVLTERIPILLSTLPEQFLFTKPEALLVLLGTLIGFKAVQQRAGAIRIGPELIGFDNFGRVRVWLNSNWAFNYPDEYSSLNFNAIRRSTTPEKTSRNGSERPGPNVRQVGMILQIVDLIQTRSVANALPPEFKYRITTSDGFFQALNSCREEAQSLNIDEKQGLVRIAQMCKSIEEDPVVAAVNSNGLQPQLSTQNVVQQKIAIRAEKTDAAFTRLRRVNGEPFSTPVKVQVSPMDRDFKSQKGYSEFADKVGLQKQSINNAQGGVREQQNMCSVSKAQNIIKPSSSDIRANKFVRQLPQEFSNRRFGLTMTSYSPHNILPNKMPNYGSRMEGGQCVFKSATKTNSNNAPSYGLGLDVDLPRFGGSSTRTSQHSQKMVVTTGSVIKRIN